MNVFVFVIIFANTATALIQNEIKNPLADHILTRLKKDQWSDEEAPCFEAAVRLYKGAINHTVWATWVIDSMQLPVGALYGSRYHLGNFDQCLDERWSSSHPELEMQYCLVDVTSQEQAARKFNPYEDAEDFFKSASRHGRRRFLNSIGVCVPASCSPQSVRKIAFHIIRSSHLPYGDVSVDARNCQRIREETAYSFGFYVFWSLIIILSTIVFIVYLIEDKISGQKLSTMAALFSPSKNFNSLTKTNADEMMLLHGLRSLSCIAIVVMHYMYCLGSLAVINHTDIGKTLESFLGTLLAHILLIETFFALSGLLLVKGLFKNLEKFKFYEFLSKRYKRFIVPYAMVLFYMVSVSLHAGSGPLWPKYLERQHGPCVRNWWLGTLMVANFVHSDDICYVVTWYLSCDFQLTILGVGIFAIWMRNRRIGYVVFIAALSLSIFIPAILTYKNKLSPLMSYDIDKSLDLSKNLMYQLVYSKIQCRAASYLVGFATGYVLTVYKPELYRKKFSKTTSITVCLVAVNIVIAMTNAVGSQMFRKDYDEIKYAFFAGTDKLIWSSAVCVFIAMSEYGTLPILTDFLGSKLFIPLSRLSYGAYLIHMAMMYINLYSLRAPITYNFFVVIVHGLGYAVIAYLLSFLQWFIIEAPASNIFSYSQNLRSNKVQNELLVHTDFNNDSKDEWKNKIVRPKYTHLL